MQNRPFRASVLIAALTVGNAAWAADFVIPVDMKNMGANWTHASVGCYVSGPNLPQKSGYAKGALVNGAFKGSLNVTVVLTAAEVPLAKNWYCDLTAASANGASSLAGNGNNAGGYANQPGTPFKVNDSGTY